jgi:lipopolysaccharide/colanic/teichoic acid biosynthesis glycosyltransferase
MPATMAMVTNGSGWHVDPPKLRRWKRITDLWVTAFLILLTAPLMIVIALILKLGRTPIFEGQPYIGADGRVFQRWQFASGSHFGFIARCRLDALPHLFNVLNGTMSLVGPQPLGERQLRHRPIADRAAYFACRPGLTGLWELEGRMGVRNGPQLDIRYVTECSPRLDLLIIARTLAHISSD